MLLHHRPNCKLSIQQYWYDTETSLHCEGSMLGSLWVFLRRLCPLQHSEELTCNQTQHCMQTYTYTGTIYTADIVKSLRLNVLTPMVFVAAAQAFQTMAKRESIKRAVERKTADFQRLFIEDLNMVKKQFDLLKRVPAADPVLPRYAGQATVALVLAKRVDHTWQALQVTLYLTIHRLLLPAKVKQDMLCYQSPAGRCPACAAKAFANRHLPLYPAAHCGDSEQVWG